mgnify:CR=1 FL=1
MTTSSRERCGNDSPVEWGMGQDDSLDPDELSLMVIAAGFPSSEQPEDFRKGGASSTDPDRYIPPNMATEAPLNISAEVARVSEVHTEHPVLPI